MKESKPKCVKTDDEHIEVDKSITEEPKQEMDDVSKMTLRYMMNREQYAKYMTVMEPIHNEKNKRDRKFYKRRIVELTKQMLNIEEPSTAPISSSAVILAFNCFVKQCILYFKMVDKTDILQEEYSGLVLAVDTQTIGQKQHMESDNDDANTLLMMRQINYKTVIPTTTAIRLTDNFITVTKSNVGINKKQQQQDIIPIQKEIDLNHHTLKKKGVRKKKNVAIIQEEETEEVNTTEKIY